MSGFWWGIAAGVLGCWFTVGAVAGVLGRHRHRWIVVALNGGSWVEGQFAYRGMLDRCSCGRMRWRPKSPVPAWWSPQAMASTREELVEPDQARHWLDTMPRWRQRRERQQVKLQLRWSTERARVEREAAEVSADGES